MRKTRRASKAKKIHDDLVKRGKLGSVVGGSKKIMYTVGVMKDGKVTDKKDFDGDKLTLNDIMASLGDNDSLVIKFYQQEYFDPKVVSDYGKYPLGNSVFGKVPFDQGKRDIVYFKLKKIPQISL